MKYKLSDIVKKEHLTFNEICYRLKVGQNFTYSRFGDGEFNAIFGVKGENCDKHQYFPDMGRELATILASKPPYEIGLLLDLKDQEYETKITTWLWDHGIHPDNITYNYSGVFHIALKLGLMPEMFQALKDRRVLLVGPWHIMKIKDRIDYELLIEVSPRNCWLDSDLVMSELDQQIRKNTVVLFCASMAANVWIHRFWKMYKNSVTLIDLGSGIDPYCGVFQRSFHHKAKLAI